MTDPATLLWLALAPLYVYVLSRAAVRAYFEGKAAYTVNLMRNLDPKEKS